MADAELAEWVRGRRWYHTLELAPGVITPGWFDLRTVAPQLPFGDLSRKRCLDVGTFDGFWAFHMEAAGASDVHAIDELDPAKWDWPSGSTDATMAAIYDRHRGGEAFPRVRELLGSRVERHHCNVYDLSPEVAGRFDVVYVGSILLHLRDPVRALEAVRSVVSPGGHVLVVDAIDLELTFLLPNRPIAGLDGLGRPWWWKPNLAGLVRMVAAAGLEPTEHRRLFLPRGAGQPVDRPPAASLLRRAGREVAVLERKGDPHGLVLAQPRS